MKNYVIQRVLIFCVLSIFCAGSGLALSSITEQEYLDAYFVKAKQFYKADPASCDGDAKELLDIIEYYLENDGPALSDNLYKPGSNSLRRIYTILDIAEAPCDCEPGGPCMDEGALCCCHQNLYVCKLDGPAPMIEPEDMENPPAIIMNTWLLQRSCGTGCCANICCEDVDGDNCWGDRECIDKYGPCNVCPNASGNCTYEGDQCYNPADCVARYGSGWSCQGVCCLPETTTTTTSSTTTTLSGCPFTCGNGECESHMTYPEYDEDDPDSICHCELDCGVNIACTVDDDCTLRCGPKWTCASGRCVYNGALTGCTDGTPMCACSTANPGKICMEGPFGDAILATDANCQVAAAAPPGNAEATAEESAPLENDGQGSNNIKFSLPLLGDITIPWF